MRYGKIIVYFLTVAFLAVAVFFGLGDPVPEVSPKSDTDALFSVIVFSNGESEQIDCWENDAGDLFVFLPSYAELSQVQVRRNSRDTICIGGRQITDGMPCDVFQLDVPYALSYTESGESRQSHLTFVRSRNTPSLYIDVQTGSMEYVHLDKKNGEPGTIRLYDAGGMPVHTGSLASISGRGNSTWFDNPKKPYSLELPAAVDLLGMGQAQNWVLLANAYDDSHLRNKIAYDFAETAGFPYSPESRWVDLYLNGEYAGLYLLCEKNEVHPQRVDLAEEDSFLVSMELAQRLDAQGAPYISTASQTALRIHYSALSDDALTQIWQSVENAILAEDGTDPITGKHWTDLIDLDSWAKKYLIEEIFGNLDAGSISQFFYRDGTGKICAGPLWDYDYALGNSWAWQIRYPNTFTAARPHIWSETDSPWFYALYQKDLFYDRVVELYQTLFQPLLEDLLEGGIDRYAAQVSQAAAMNAIRWSSQDAGEEAAHIRSFLTERIAFLDSVWLDNTQYCTVQINIDQWSSFGCYAVLPGTPLPKLPGYEYLPDAIGWYYVETDEPFSVDEPICESTAIYMKQTAADASPSFLSSVIKYVPIAALLVMMAVVFFADKKYRHPRGAREQLTAFQMYDKMMH